MRRQALSGILLLVLTLLNMPPIHAGEMEDDPTLYALFVLSREKEP